MRNDSVDEVHAALSVVKGPWWRPAADRARACATQFLKSLELPNACKRSSLRGGAQRLCLRTMCVESIAQLHCCWLLLIQCAPGRAQMVELASKKFICIVDESKLVSGLGGSKGMIHSCAMDVFWMHAGLCCLTLASKGRLVTWRPLLEHRMSVLATFCTLSGWLSRLTFPASRATAHLAWQFRAC